MSRRTSGRRVHSVEQSVGDTKPLVRVDNDRVRPLPAVETVTELRAHRCGASVCSVDVEPDAGLLAAICDLGHGIDGGRRRRPDRRDDSARALEREQLGPETEVVVRGDLSQLELEQLRRLVDRGVRVLGAHDHAVSRPSMARSRKSDEGTGRRGVLDVAVKPSGKAEKLREPAERDLLQLLERRRRPPQDPDLVQPGCEKLGQNRAARCSSSRSTRRNAGSASASTRGRALRRDP